MLDDRHRFVRADVRLSGGRIRRIAPNLDPADRDLQAPGLTLSPGFIDIHCHSDFAALVYPRVESKVLALLQRYGIAAPPSADLSRAVVMSFSAAAVWRIRRAAPLLPTVLLGETSRYLGGGAATTVGATAVGPSIATLREHPELVDRAAAQGRAMYCWTVDHYEDVEFCRELGVAWVATNHPGRTKDWLQNGLTGAGRDAPE